MDDIICMGKTKEELKHNTIEVLKILEEHDLYIKDTKCYWEVERVPLLGYIVSEGHINMEETKTKVVQDWQIPKTKNALQKFLGFLNFY